MAETKKVNINFYNIESQEESFFLTLSEKLATLFDAGMDYGFFEARNRELMFKLFETVEVNGSPWYLFGLVKEKASWPVWYNREGAITEVPLDAGTLGDITYGFAGPNDRILLTGAGLAGRGAFAEFFRWLTDDASASLEHIFITDAYERVRNWEVFRKLELSVEAPTGDFVDEVMNTRSGQELGSIFTTLEGMKLDVSISMGNNKGSMNSGALKEFLDAIISDNYAKKLNIYGKGFEEESAENIDLLSAKLKHTSEVGVQGTFVNAEEMRSAFLDAYYNNQQHLVDEEGYE
ncbi:DUF6731 family protein [Limisalsivibrio acetivorans]|uniref:DUF6731 family protein n=1 Tax=Limisalsivibrio acetivorans TaxID=1304888 RepID=UPI0003B31CAF|nr:DUF6731 family protein [Limisalsivibrio acetivorans]